MLLVVGAVVCVVCAGGCCRRYCCSQKLMLFCISLLPLPHPLPLLSCFTYILLSSAIRSVSLSFLLCQLAPTAICAAVHVVVAVVKCCCLTNSKMEKTDDCRCVVTYAALERKTTDSNKSDDSNKSNKSNKSNSNNSNSNNSNSNNSNINKSNNSNSSN